MPIERDRYAENWDEIALAVKNAAAWRCEHCGKACLRPGEDWLAFVLQQGWTVAEAVQHSQQPVRFVLTTAHLDQNPGNNSKTNLRALCSICHLKHDRPFRQANALAKRERRGQLTVFQLTHPQPAGHGKDPERFQPPLTLELEP